MPNSAASKAAIGPVATMVVIAACTLNAISALRACFLLFRSSRPLAGEADLTFSEHVRLWPLVVLVLGLGFWPLP